MPAVLEAMSPFLQSERLFGNTDDDRIAYDALRALMEDGTHGQRWEAVDFDGGTDSPFRLDRPFLPVIERGARRHEPLETFAPFLITPASQAKLSDAVNALYDSGKIRDHLRKGGSLALAYAPHLSYADLPVTAALAAQRNPEAASNQSVVIHRQVTLFKKWGQQIVGDGIRKTSNVLLTFPNSASGRDNRVTDYREPANDRFSEAYDRLIILGAHTMHIAASGSSPKDGLVPRVSKKTSSLFTHANSDGDERLLTVGVAMDINPFKGDGLEPHDVAFQFFEPLPLRDDAEFQELSVATIAVYNAIKRPQAPWLEYESREAYEHRIELTANQQQAQNDRS